MAIAPSRAAPRRSSKRLRRLTIAADWTLLIAPETGGMLLDRCRLVESAGGRLLSPPAKCVEIAASKQRTSELLERGGVRVPRGRLLSQWDHRVPPEFPMPAVIKPDEGCGSLGVRLVRRAADLRDETVAGAVRLEQFIPGLPASVAVICGPAGNHALPACEQRLSADGTFAYRGGRLPLAPQLDARARRLALAAIAAMPQPRGYLGVDLVLGEAEDGSGDCVIEINPRLTTSYIGLRAAADTNLAAAMLDIASGRQPDLCFGPGPVEFTADGTIL